VLRLTPMLIPSNGARLKWFVESGIDELMAETPPQFRAPAVILRARRYPSHPPLS